MKSDRKIVARLGGTGGWGIRNVLDLSQNEISGITGKDLMATSADNIIGTSIRHVDVANNRMDFKALNILVQQVLFGANDSRSHWSDMLQLSDITYAPQKKLGDKRDAVTLDNGVNHELSFSLRDGGNKYTWLLNGKAVPGADGKTLPILDFGPEQGGIYTCAVTNEALPGLVIESVDMPVWAKKEGNQAPNSISLSRDKAVATTPAFSVIATLSGSDPDGDVLSFRLVDEENHPYNSSFRIKDGNTLISSEELFERDFLTEYKIKVQAYDAFGGTLDKVFVIKRVNLPEGAKLANEFSLSSFDVSENEDAVVEVGSIALNSYSTRWQVDGRTMRRIEERVDLLGQYTLSLPAGLQDNDWFEVKDGKLLTKKTFNYEQQKTLTVSVKATHKDNPEIFSTQLFTVRVTDVNDAPSVVALSNNVIKDNDSAGKIVGTLLSSDEDPGDLKFKFSLSPGTSNASAFTVQNQFLRTRKKLEAGLYNLQVRATDPHGAFVDQPLKVVVLQTDEDGEVNKKAAEIMYTDDLSLRVGDPALVLKGYSTSDAKVSYSLVEGAGVIRIDGAEIKALAPGTAKVKASVAETEFFLSAEKVFTVTVNPKNVKSIPEIKDFDDLHLSLSDGKTRLTAHSNSGAKVEYTIVSGTETLTLDEPYIIPKKVGTAKIKATVRETDNFATANKTITVTIKSDGTKTTPTIYDWKDFSITLGSNAVVLGAHSDSDAKVVYEVVSGASHIQLQGNRVTAKTAGTATLKASVASTDTYSFAEKTVQVTVKAAGSKTTPTISDWEDFSITLGSNAVVLGAHSDSDAKVVYEVVSGASHIQLQGNRVTAKTAGTATLKASVASTDIYSFAEKTVQVTVKAAGSKTTPTISDWEDFSITLGGNTVVLGAHSDSDAKVVYEVVSGASHIQLQGNRVTAKTAGTATLKASVMETEKYKSFEKTVTVTITETAQLKESVITNFDNQIHRLNEGTFSLAAYTNSTAKVRYEVIEGMDLLHINGAIATLISAGTVKIRAYVEATGEYSSAEKTASIRIIATDEMLETQILGFDDLEKNMSDNAFALTAYSESPAKVNYEIVSGAEVVSLDGITITPLTPGLASVRAFVDATDNYEAVEKTIVIRINTVTAIGSSGKRMCLYPNPVSEVLQIKTAHVDEKAEVTVFDQNGKVLLKENLSVQGDAYRLNVTELHPGIYRIVLRTEKEVITGTISKK
ncbi:T9SS type A sorting domain-containing protein [Fulvitalea axinellae]